MPSLEGPASSQGCLISHPSSLVGTRFFREPPSGWPKLTLFHERMKELLKKGPRLNVYEELSPEMLELSDAAKRAWIQFHNDIAVSYTHLTLPTICSV